MSDPQNDLDARWRAESVTKRSGSRMSVLQIARRLDIGRLAVYAMLEQGVLPGIRLGRRWIITRHAYEQWERTCGMHNRLPSTEELTTLH
jgi:excisionase family DNA binding protein